MQEDAVGRVGRGREGVISIGHFVGLGGAVNLILKLVLVVPSLVVAIAELDHDIVAAGDGTELGALELPVEGVARGILFSVPVRLVAIVPVVTGVIIAGVEFALSRFVIARVVHRFGKSASGECEDGNDALELFVHL